MANEDLLRDTSQPDPIDKNYFLVTITDLVPGEEYPIQFRYKYKDGTPPGPWSATKLIETPYETVPAIPTFTSADVTFSQGIITVNWPGTSTSGSYPPSLDRIDVYLQANDDTPLVYVKKGSISTANQKLSIPVIPGSYSVQLRAFSKSGFASGYSQTVSVIAKATPPNAVTSVVPSWSGTDFNLTFSSNPSSVGNEYLSHYQIKLTAGIITRSFRLDPVSGASQKFALSLAQNRAAFGTPETSFTGSITPYDIYGNPSTEISFNPVSYVSPLSAPVITATAIQQGYSISYTTPTSSVYSGIEIEEIESSASSAPSSGYSAIFYGLSNPAVIIVSNQNKRWIRARFVDNIGAYTSYSTAISTTPLSPVTADTQGPSAPSSNLTASSGIDTSGTVGFNGYIDLSWSAISDSSLRGYRIRFRTGTTAYSYVDSPGTGTTYRLRGLAVGATYEIGIASYDEYNNTSSSYSSFTSQTISGTPSLSNYISAGNFKLGYGVDTSSDKGLYLDSSNYWYLNASDSARLKVGGTTSNYLEWNGTTFAIDGNITARQGTFSGNVSIASGGSLYSGTISGGSLSGAGYILNSSGLTFNSSSVNGITTINASTGKLTTASAAIGGWDVTSAAIAKTSSSGTLTLDSSNAQIRVSSSSYQAGIATPNTNAGTDIVFWAGGTRDTSANFYVRADGTVVMKAASITGYATTGTTDALSTSISGKISTGGAASDVNNNTTNISGDKVRTGAIEGPSYSYSSGSYSTSGMRIDLTNNYIRSPYFYISNSGANFKGSITGATGTFSDQISGATITAGSGVNTLTIGSNGAISHGTGAFSVSAAGKLTVTGADIGGKVTADSGAIGGWNINATGILQSGTTYLYGSYDDPALSEDAAIADIARGCLFKTGYFLSGGVTVAGGGNIGTSSGSLVSTTGNIIAGSGNVDVGIGTTTLYSDGRIYANTLGVYTGTQAYAVRQVYAGGSGTNASGFLRVNTSSRRFKKNIAPLIEGNYMDLLTRLSPVSYIDRNEDEDSPRAFGLIAEEVAEISELKDGLVPRDADGNPGAVHYELIGVLSLMALKEIKTKLENIEKRLDVLEA